MENLLTFFRSRGDEHPTYRILTTQRGNSQAIFVFSRQQLPTQLLNAQYDTETTLAKLVAFMREQGNGIVIVISKTDSSQYAIEAHYASDQRQITYFCISLTQSTFAKAQIGQTIRIGKGDHLIIPVDATAQQHLRKFIDVLGYFPQDTELLLLNMLRQPILEFKGQTVENWAKTLQKQLPGAGAAAYRTTNTLQKPVSKPRQRQTHPRSSGLVARLYRAKQLWQQKWSRLCKNWQALHAWLQEANSLKLALIISSLAIVIISTLSLALRNDYHRKSQAEQMARFAANIASTKLATTAANDPKIEQAVADLVDYIAKPAIHRLDHKLHLLWDKYLAPAAGTNNINYFSLSDQGKFYAAPHKTVRKQQQGVAWRKKPGLKPCGVAKQASGQTTAKNTLENCQRQATDPTLVAFYSGIIKLVVVTSGVAIGDHSFLTQTTSWSKTITIFKKYAIIKKLDHERRMLLSIAACELFNVPGIAPLRDGQDALIFSKSVQCDQLSPQDTLAGIRKLKQAVVNYVDYRP